MKYFTVITGIIVMAFVLSACNGQGETTTLRDDINISVTTPDDTLAMGETTLMVTVTNEDGSPVDGATVNVHGDMDHEGMDSVEATVSESLDGMYTVPFTWTMGGGWILTVTVDLPENGGQASAEFEYFVEAISQDSVINQDNDGMNDNNMDMDMDMSNDDN